MSRQSSETKNTNNTTTTSAWAPTLNSLQNAIGYLGNTYNQSAAGSTATQDQIDGRQRRKRRSRSKTGRENPAASAALRVKWSDPAYREKQSQINREVLPIGRRTRTGVPDGLSREEADRLWKKAEKQADITMSALLRNGQLEFDPHIERSGDFKFDDDISEEQMAWWCLREAFIIALSPINDKQVKNRALRFVLTYTKPKSAAKFEVTLQQEADNEARLQMVIEDHLATPRVKATTEC
jgi:hypothetical protein